MPHQGHRRRAWALAVLAALACVSSAGCDAIVDTNTNQCEKDADCQTKGAAFAGTLCTAEKVCGKITCHTHSDCTDRLGELGYCRPSDSTCAKVGSEDCTGGVYPGNALEEKDVLLIGFLGQLRGDYMSYGTPLKEGAELALHDIETNTNGLPPVGNGGQRHLAMVLCHDMDDPVRAATHLVDDLGVPAIIGPAFSGKTQTVVHDAGLHERLLVVTASATTPALSNEKSPYFWRTVPSDDIQAKALTKLVAKGVDVLMKKGAPVSTTDASVAVAYIDNAYGNGISRSFFDTTSKLNVTPVAYTDPSTISAAQWKQTDAPHAAQQIVQAVPNIIVGLATTEFDTDVLPGIEKGWMSMLSPLYLLSEGARVAELSAAVTSYGLSGRLLGTAPGARSSAGYGGFARAFQATFGHSPGNLAEFAYDAAYLVAYATAIADVERPSATDLANAMSHVTCKDANGVKVAAGPTNFSNYFGQAALTKCIDFDGISGPLDFDAVTHEAPSDIAIWCPLPSGEIVKDAPYYSFEKDDISPNDAAFDFTCSGQ